MTRRVYPSATERFFANLAGFVDPDGCWLWSGSVNQYGYGHLSVNGRLVQAHRFSFELSNGPIQDGAELLHSCDTRRCCNPRHLSEGSRAENVHDMARKNRGSKSNRGLSYGVSRRGDRYISQVKFLGALHYLGTYATELEAHSVAESFKRSLYHP